MPARIQRPTLFLLVAFYIVMSVSWTQSVSSHCILQRNACPLDLPCFFSVHSKEKRPFLRHTLFVLVAFHGWWECLSPPCTPLLTHHCGQDWYKVRPGTLPEEKNKQTQPTRSKKNITKIRGNTTLCWVEFPLLSGSKREIPSSSSSRTRFSF